MSKLYTLICFSFLLNLPFSSFSQCTFNNFFNSSVVLSGGAVSNVPCVQGGQYVSIQVTAGETYLIETCGSSTGGDTQITLFDAFHVRFGYFQTINYKFSLKMAPQLRPLKLNTLLDTKEEEKRAFLFLRKNSKIIF